MWYMIYLINYINKYINHVQLKHFQKLFVTFPSVCNIAEFQSGLVGGGGGLG